MRTEECSLSILLTPWQGRGTWNTHQELCITCIFVSLRQRFSSHQAGKGYIISPCIAFVFTHANSTSNMLLMPLTNLFTVLDRMRFSLQVCARKGWTLELLKFTDEFILWLPGINLHIMPSPSQSNGQRSWRWATIEGRRGEQPVTWWVSPSHYTDSSWFPRWQKRKLFIDCLIVEGQLLQVSG